MCKPHTLRALCVYARSFPAFVLFFTVVPACFSQHTFQIPDPLEAGQRLDVLAVNDGMYLANDGFGFNHYDAHSFYLNEAEAFADGYISVESLNGYILDKKSKFTFKFEVEVESDRDFEDCFVVLHLFCSNGGEYFLPFEIGDLHADQTQKIDVSADLKFELDRGIYRYYFFSGGREILFESNAMHTAK